MSGCELLHYLLVLAKDRQARPVESCPNPLRDLRGYTLSVFRGIDAYSRTDDSKRMFGSEHPAIFQLYR